MDLGFLDLLVFFWLLAFGVQDIDFVLLHTRHGADFVLVQSRDRQH